MGALVERVILFGEAQFKGLIVRVRRDLAVLRVAFVANRHVGQKLVEQPSANAKAAQTSVPSTSRFFQAQSRNRIAPATKMLTPRVRLKSFWTYTVLQSHTAQRSTMLLRRIGR
jgi:hypothetical protein